MKRAKIPVPTKQTCKQLPTLSDAIRARFWKKTRGDTTRKYDFAQWNKIPFRDKRRQSEKTHRRIPSRLDNRETTDDHRRHRYSYDGRGGRANRNYYRR
ncbi:hypothetical protein DPMN_087198 [Dreissena polymorpha]|uniref:Uncharacterized protein n=1 Tax=Dreissena polymorpha TaxID=45954 RepID=A0A9D4KTF1_DREPO|nr:hypothetical protein DPMN_087198 [Dreissena polymorpha]